MSSWQDLGSKQVSHSFISRSFYTTSKYHIMPNLSTSRFFIVYIIVKVKDLPTMLLAVRKILG